MLRILVEAKSGAAMALVMTCSLMALTVPSYGQVS